MKINTQFYSCIWSTLFFLSQALHRILRFWTIPETEVLPLYQRWSMQQAIKIQALTAHYRCAKKRHRLCFRKFASRPAGIFVGSA